MATSDDTIIEANGALIPRIGLGTWPMKGDTCVRAVAAAIEAGYRHIDTAAMYGNEVEVGEGVRAGGVPRDDVFVTTKVWYTDLKDGPLQRSCEKSLRALKFDIIDLLLVHWPNEAVPLAETMRALSQVKREGMARHIGVSNFTPALVDEAAHRASEPLAANQCEHHPKLDQTEMIAATRAHGMAFVSYCPLGRGVTGGLLDNRVVREIAERHERTPAQILLRWHLQHDGVAAIPKSATPERIRDNIAVFDFMLDEDEMARLTALGRSSRIVAPDIAPAWD